MTNKKKRGRPDIEELLARPWCYYCERDFDDLKILINHQKAKHFKCDRCNRRLNTAGGLSVHMNQVHKENLTAIDNALAGRTGLDHEIFGMEGVPEDVKQAHNRRVIEEFSQAERERQAATGNPAPGSGANVAKKPKIESTQSLKERLAAHKAAKQQQQQNGDGSTGSNTPTSISAQPVVAAQPSPQPQAPQASSYAGYQAPYAVTQAHPTTYGQPTTYNPPQTQPPFPPAGYQMQQPYGQTAPPPQQLPYGQPPQPYGQPYGQLPPQPYPPNQPYPAPSSISPPPFAGTVPQVGSPFQAQTPQNGLPPHHVGRAPSGSPVPHVQGRTHSPLNGVQQRPPSVALPGAPGLPQRPAVGAPPVNAAQFQQMHQGQIPATNTHAVPKVQHHGYPSGQTQPQQVSGRTPAQEDPVGASSLDDLISSASRQADANAAASADASKAATPQPPTVSTPSKDDATDKKATAQKDKDKSAKTTRLVYSDNDISPEEKMAQMPRYAFDPTQRTVVA